MNPVVSQRDFLCKHDWLIRTEMAELYKKVKIYKIYHGKSYFYVI